MAANTDKPFAAGGNPANANFRAAAYNKMSFAWSIVAHIWAGTLCLREQGKAYLPQEPAEDDESYKSRLSRAVLFNAFRRTVQAMVGMVLRKEPTLNADVPEEIKQQAENIDAAGNVLAVFAKRVFQAALRDGHSFIYVDMPPAPTESETAAPRPTLKDEVAQGLPFWNIYEADQAVNWRYTTERGQKVLEQITFCEQAIEDAGEFGERKVTRYRVLRPGAWQLYEVKKENGVERLELEREGTTSLSYIPLAVVGDHECLMSQPPLLDLALLNVKHYQLSSDLDNVIHISHVPILWAKGRDTTKPMQPIGASILIDLEGEKEAALGYAEIAGNGIEHGVKRIERLERQMAVLGLEMLAEQDHIQQTATEVNNSSAQSNSELASYARSLQDALEAACGFHADYLGKGKEAGGSITLNVEYDRLVLSPEKMRVLREYVVDNVLDVETVLDLLQRAGELPDDVDIKEVLKRLFGASADKSSLARDAEAMKATRDALPPTNDNSPPTTDNQPPIN